MNYLMMTSWHRMFFKLLLISTSPLWNPPVMHNFNIFFVVSWKQLFNKQSSCQLFEIPWHSCDAAVMIDEDLIHHVLLYTLFQLVHACYAYKNNRITWIMQKHYINLCILSACIEYQTVKPASKKLMIFNFRWNMYQLLIEFYHDLVSWLA